MLTGKQSIKTVCADYRKNRSDYWRRTLAYYAGLKSINTTLNETGLFHCDSTHCDPHQRRIHKTNKLLFLSDLNKCQSNILKTKDFQSHYDCIWSNCKKKCVPEFLLD